MKQASLLKIWKRSESEMCPYIIKYTTIAIPARSSQQYITKHSNMLFLKQKLRIAITLHLGMVFLWVAGVTGLGNRKR